MGLSARDVDRRAVTMPSDSTAMKRPRCGDATIAVISLYLLDRDRTVVGLQTLTNLIWSTITWNGQNEA
jgi:hypothetical protein